MTKRVILLAAVVLSWVAFCPVCPGDGPPKPTDDVDLLWAVKVPLRDGVKLNATVYKPKAQEPLPVVFTLTPYIADSWFTSRASLGRRCRDH